MSKGKITLISIAVVLIIIVGSFIGTYNGLAKSQQTVKAQESNIDTVLQRRNDLIPNVVATVKGYAKHEEEIFTAVTNARASMMKAGTISEKSAANNEMESSLSRLLAVVENYPTLKADTQFTALTTELEGSENRIAVARKNYNDAVNEYNSKLIVFPTNIVAGMFGFRQADYFKADESAKTAPKVNF